MAEPYENTIHGLLKKRRDLLGETDRLRKALTATLEDTRALDRTLRALGHKGDLKRMTPAGTRQVVFHRDELRRYLLDQLRLASKPLDAPTCGPLRSGGKVLSATWPLNSPYLMFLHQI